MAGNPVLKDHQDHAPQRQQGPKWGIGQKTGQDTVWGVEAVKSNVGGPRMKSSPRKRWYLNDYFPETPRLRVELTRGAKVVCVDRTTEASMLRTKKYLDKTWKTDSLQ